MRQRRQQEIVLDMPPIADDDRFGDYLGHAAIASGSE
jgi:hypothetical protein